MANLEQSGVQLIAQGAAQFQADMGAASKAVDGFGATTNAAAGQTEHSSNIMIGALRQVGALAVDALAKAGQAVGAFVADSVSKAGDFQQGMLEFQAVAGRDIDTKGLEAFRAQFIQLGKELPVSTADVQQAAIELVKGGIDPATIAAGGLEQSIKFAAAAMDGDLAAAAETSAKIVGGWADVTATAEQKAALLTHATDLLTKAANASTVDVKDLSLGLYNVQGTAKAAGLSLDETTTALAELAPRFSDANTAGTAFRNFLVRLQPTTAPATEAMNELGLMTTSTTKIMQFLQAQGIQPLGTDLDTLGNQFTEFAAKNGFTAKETTKLWGSFAQSKFFDEATGKFIGVAAASDLLRDATKDLTDAQRIQAFQTIFGNDAMNAAAAFAEMGAQGYDAMTASLEKANGVQENAALKQQGWNTALENAKGSVEALQITVGSALLPVLTDLLNNVIAPGINTLTTLADALFGSQEAFNQLSPALQAVVLTAEQAWASVQSGVAFLQELIATFQSTSAESSALGGVLDSLAGVWTNLLGTIEAVAAGYEAIIEAVLPLVSGFIEAHGDEIMGFFKETFDTIVDIVNVALDLYNKVVGDELARVAAFIQTHGALITDILTNVWTIIKTTISAALEITKGILKAALQIFQGDWSGAWETIKTMSENVVKDLWEIIKAGLGLIANLFGDTLENIGATWAHNWETFKDGVSRGADALVKLFTDLPGKLAGVGEAIVNAIWDGIRGKWQELVDWFDAKLEELRNQLPFSEPKDPSSPLRGLRKSGEAIATMIGEGMRSAGPLPLAALVAPPASPAQIASAPRGGSVTTNTTSRTVNVTYNTAVAPPVSQSLALAQALV